MLALLSKMRASFIETRNPEMDCTGNCSGDRRQSPLKRGHSCCCPIGTKSRQAEARLARVVGSGGALVAGVRAAPDGRMYVGEPLGLLAFEAALAAARGEEGK